MRHRTSGPYARAAFGSSIAAAMQRTAGSAAFTAAMRSAVNVAIPHRRGLAEATKAIRTEPFCGASALSAGNARLRGRVRGSATRAWPSTTRALNLSLSRDRKAGDTPRGETPAHVRDVTTSRFEDAGGEARADPPGAVGHDRSVRWD